METNFNYCKMVVMSNNITVEPSQRRRAASAFWRPSQCNRRRQGGRYGHQHHCFIASMQIDVRREYRPIHIPGARLSNLQTVNKTFIQPRKWRAIKQEADLRRLEQAGEKLCIVMLNQDESF